jgi:hypothetical protein
MNAFPSVQVPEPKPRPAPASQSPYSYRLGPLRRWIYEYLSRCEEEFRGQHRRIAEAVSEDEFGCLYELASDEQEGNILELGTAAGFSTVALAGGTSWRIVHAVDPEQPYNLTAPPEDWVTEEVWEMRRIMRDWLWNELGLENIRFHRTTAEEFDPTLCGLLGVLFIDGKGTRPGPLHDFLRFHRHVVSGGYIVFRGYTNPALQVREELDRLRHEYLDIWECMEREIRGSLAIFKLMEEWPEFPPMGGMDL